MKILSLFDGMACGAIAFGYAGVEIESYDAYEIDKYAIKTATHNFPFIRQHGDVFSADFTQYEGVDFLIGGSPCTYWSIAQTKNRETVASGMGWELFSQYVRALHEAKPKYFIYENNKSMSKQIRASIDEAFGFEAVLINSALVSAQNRQRLYWVGRRNADGTYSKVDVEQPADRGILLKDVLDNAVAMRNKARAVIASTGRTTEREHFVKNQGNMVAEPVGIRQVGRRVGEDGHRHDYDESLEHEQRFEVNENPQKSNCVSTVQKDCMVAEPVGIKHLGSLYGQHSRWGVFAEEGKAPTLTAAAGMGGGHLPMIPEPVCMRYERSEEAKACRKAYEAHEIQHGYHELHELHPRTDGKTNTLSTVLKDNPICEPIQVGAMPRPNGELSTSQGFRIYSANAKSVSLKGNAGGSGGKTGLYAIRADGTEMLVYEVKDGKITIKGKQYPIKLKDGYYIIRKLTVSECKRLQTVPEWYEFTVSNSQAYKMLGNGWTCEVIAHIVRSCLLSVNTIGGN